MFQAGSPDPPPAFGERMIQDSSVGELKIFILSRPSPDGCGKFCSRGVFISL